MQLTWTRTVADAQWPTLRDNICAALGYQATIVDANGNTVANPQTKPQCIDLAIFNWLRTLDRAGRAQLAASSASSPTNDIPMT